MIKVELKIVFSSANLYFPPPLRNYETSFGTKGHLKIPTVTKQHMVKKLLLVWLQKYGITFKYKLKIPL